MNKEDVLGMIQELNEKQTETICIETKTANAGKPDKYYDTIYVKKAYAFFTYLK